MNERPSRPPAPWRQAAALSGLALCVLSLLVWALFQGRPVPVPDAPVLHVPCLSYAPFRRPGHTPADPGLRLEPAQIEADLRRLRALTGCVRTYGVGHGLDAVPAIARALGMRVLLGAWIDGDAPSNAAQLERALALGRDYPDVIDLLIIGNEVLLRGEQAPAALAALLARARRESAVPIAYADVWAFWLRHAEALRAHVDVVAIHVLPYWEDTPVALEQAVEHVAGISAEVSAVFAPTPVFIAETGWPAAGRQRGPALPGRVEQTRFVRAVLAAQARSPLASRTAAWPAINLIEGFDQPWKRRQEGAMGGYWGVFDAAGQPRVSLRGPVLADPQWWRTPLGIVAGAIAGWIWARRGGPPTTSAGGRTLRCRRPARLAMSLAGALVVPLLLLQGQMLVEWSDHPFDWAFGIVISLAAGLCALAAARRLGQILDGQRSAGSRPGLIAALLAPKVPGTRALAFAQAALLGSVVLIALGLLFDARYRPLVWPMLAAPAALLPALTVLGDRLEPGAWIERALAVACAVAAVALVWLEDFTNMQALRLALVWLCLAAAVGWPHAPASARDRGRAGG